MWLKWSGKSDIIMHVADELMKEGVIVYVIDPSQDWQARSNIPFYFRVRDITKLTPIHNSSTVYDTSRLDVADQRAFMEAFCKALMDFAIAQQAEERRWRFVIFEEAQLIYPNGSFRSDKKSASLQLVSVGRNFKARFGAITPFSSSIDKYLVKTTKQRFFGWTNEKNDKDYLRGFLGRDMERLARLKAGQFIYHNPQANTTEQIQIEPHRKEIALRLATMLMRDMK